MYQHLQHCSRVNKLDKRNEVWIKWFDHFHRIIFYWNYSKEQASNRSANQLVNCWHHYYNFVQDRSFVAVLVRAVISKQSTYLLRQLDSHREGFWSLLVRWVTSCAKKLQIPFSELWTGSKRENKSKHLLERRLAKIGIEKVRKIQKQKKHLLTKKSTLANLFPVPLNKLAS